MTASLEAFKKHVHIVTLVLGVVALVVAQMADTSRAAGLYTAISLGPIAAGLITIYRHKVSSGTDKSVAKIVVECAWVDLSFGLGFLMMLPSSYYAVQSPVSVLLGIDAVVMAVYGLYVLINLNKMGFSLTP